MVGWETTEGTEAACADTESDEGGVGLSVVVEPFRCVSVVGGGTTEGATHLPSFFRLMAGRCGVGYAGACGTLDYGVFPPECVAGGVFFI